MHNKSAQRKPAKHKKTSRGKISTQGLTIVSKKYNLEAKKRHSGVSKGLQLINVITPAVVNHLS